MRMGRNGCEIHSTSDTPMLNTVFAPSPGIFDQKSLLRSPAHNNTGRRRRRYIAEERRPHLSIFPSHPLSFLSSLPTAEHRVSEKSARLSLVLRTLTGLLGASIAIVFWWQNKHDIMELLHYNFRGRGWHWHLSSMVKVTQTWHLASLSLSGNPGFPPFFREDVIQF